MPSCTFIHLHMQVPHLEVLFLTFLLNKTQISLLSFRKHATPRLYSQPAGPVPCSTQGLLLPRHSSYYMETIDCAGVLWKVCPRWEEGLCLLPLHPITFHCEIQWNWFCRRPPAPLALTTSVQIFLVLAGTICIFARVFSPKQARSSCPSQEPSDNT